jgi:branched-chain amino acid transport system substrate-binding protein
MLPNENELSPEELLAFDKYLSIPSGNWSGPEYLKFRQEFQNTYKKNPGMVASYSFDGMSVLVEAIRKAGSDDRVLIQESLRKIHHRGVTGLIQFDNKGNRSGNFKLMGLRNGVPASPE